MKISIQKIIPSWEVALPISGPVIGTLGGVISRLSGNLPFWVNPRLADPMRTRCFAGFDNPLLNSLNMIGQSEIKYFAMAGSVFAPIVVQGIARSDYSQKNGVWGKILETVKKTAGIFKNEIRKDQKIAGGILLMMGGLGLVKPALQMICQPISPAPELIAPIAKFISFEPSGHFFTKIMTTALGISVTKTLSANSSPSEKRALTACLALNAIKDAALLYGTLANHCHSPQEAIAGSLVALAGIAVGCALLSGSENKELPPSISKMEIQSAGSNQFRVVYGSEKALVDWENEKILEGTLPPNVLKTAALWAQKRRKGLQEQPERSLFLVKKGMA